MEVAFSAGTVFDCPKAGLVITENSSPDLPASRAEKGIAADRVNWPLGGRDQRLSRATAEAARAEEE